jgi:hypothetical protein
MDNDNNLFTKLWYMVIKNTLSAMSKEGFNGKMYWGKFSRLLELDTGLVTDISSIPYCGQIDDLHELDEYHQIIERNHFLRQLVSIRGGGKPDMVRGDILVWTLKRALQLPYNIAQFKGDITYDELTNMFNGGGLENIDTYFSISDTNRMSSNISNELIDQIDYYMRN